MPMALSCRGALCPCNRPVLAGIKARVMDRAGLDRRQNRTCGQGLRADLTGCVIPALRVMLLSCSPPLTPLLPSGQSLASHGLPGCGGFAPAVFCTPASITKPVAALFACVRRPLHERLGSRHPHWMMIPQTLGTTRPETCLHPSRRTGLLRIWLHC